MIPEHPFPLFPSRIATRDSGRLQSSRNLEFHGVFVSCILGPLARKFPGNCFSGVSAPVKKGLTVGEEGKEVWIHSAAWGFRGVH